MKFKSYWKKRKWEKGVKKNQDAYGAEIYDYAKRWAEAMESIFDKTGKFDGLVAEELSTAYANGITGFMYGCAVSILSQAWIYGEELRKWHNLKYQFQNEGEIANKSKKAVLNPALVTCSCKK